MLWVGWSLIAYRDIPVAELEQRYGGDNLQRFDHEGLGLRYRVSGDGPPLLLIHSHYFNMRIWDGWIPTLAEHFTVIRYDLTSHGLTGPEPNGDYSMQRDVDIAFALLDHLQVDDFAVVGSSLGGNIAFHMAAQTPDRIRQLVLVNSGGIPRANSRTEGTIPPWVDYVSYLVPRAAFEAFMQWMIIDDAVVTDELSREFHAMFRREGNRFAEFARLRAFESSEPSATLAEISAPVLLMWGEDNPQLPTTQVDGFVERLTSAESVTAEIYPGMGHVIPLEMPALGSKTVRDFLLGVSQ